MSKQTITDARLQEALRAVVYLDCWQQDTWGQTIERDVAIRELQDKGFTEPVKTQYSAGWTLAHLVLFKHHEAGRLEFTEDPNPPATYRALDSLIEWAQG